MKVQLYSAIYYLKRYKLTSLVIFVCVLLVVIKLGIQIYDSKFAKVESIKVKIHSVGMTNSNLSVQSRQYNARACNGEVFRFGKETLLKKGDSLELTGQRSITGKFYFYNIKSINSFFCEYEN